MPTVRGRDGPANKRRCRGSRIAAPPRHRPTSLRKYRRRPLLMLEHPGKNRQLLPVGSVVQVPCPPPAAGDIQRSNLAGLTLPAAAGGRVPSAVRRSWPSMTAEGKRVPAVGADGPSRAPTESLSSGFSDSGQSLEGLFSVPVCRFPRDTDSLRARLRRETVRESQDGRRRLNQLLYGLSLPAEEETGSSRLNPDGDPGAGVRKPRSKPLVPYVGRSAVRLHPELEEVLV